MSSEIDVMMLFKGLIPDDRLDETIDLSYRGESTSALEIFCTQILDEELRISREIYERIKTLCDDASVAKKYCEMLEKLVESPPLK